MASPQPEALYGAGHRLFALTIAIALAVSLLWSSARVGQLRMVPSEWQPSTWVDGFAGRQVNAALGTLPGQATIDRWSAAFRYRFLGDLGTQVREGCTGWLFYRDGLRPPAAHPDVFPKRVELMRHWASQFDSAGVQLLVAMVPDKSRIEAQHLCGLQPSPTNSVRWESWKTALATSSVPFIDLRAPLAELPQSFYRTDVHMAPAGAEAAAGRIAEILLVPLGGKGAQKFAEVRGQEQEVRMGDLIVLAGLDQAPSDWRPALEKFVPERIEAERSGGLLDEVAPSEVLLLGDSNGLRSEFSERLGRRVGREVWNLSQDGGYFSGAMLTALARQEAWPKSLKVVVWVFSELSLSLPLSEEEQRAWDSLR